VTLCTSVAAGKGGGLWVLGYGDFVKSAGLAGSQTVFSSDAQAEAKPRQNQALLQKRTMLRLRLNNPVPARLAHHKPFPWLAPDSPWKPRIDVPTNRRFHLVCLRQKDGLYVASVVEAPSILVYDESRKTAEETASKRFLRKPDPHAYMAHPLATTKAVTVDMELDEQSNSFVTYVKELHGMSTYGETELAALDNTAEMVRGYIKSMEANHMKIPLTAAKLKTLKRLVGIR